ncbi:MAG: M48 family metalloprotease [Saprospiraceae bacterium]
MTYGRSNYGGRGRGFNKGTLIIAIVLAGFALIRHYSSRELNEFTGEHQVVNMSVEQEIALGLQSAPKMAAQHGGLHPDEEAQAMIDRVGQKLVNNSVARETGYRWDFHLLADPNTVNAFALPGGQCFITAALAERLQTEDQLAGVLGHEIGHVIARHSAERIAKQQLTQDLTGAAVIATGDYNTAQAAAMISNLVNMKYGRDQELQSDDLGVRFMMMAGYDPREMVGVMEILKQAAGGGGAERQPEFFSTHPNPENRKEKIMESIEKYRNMGVGR